MLKDEKSNHEKSNYEKSNYEKIKSEKINAEKIKNLQKEYEALEIPDQLAEVVHNTINNADSELLQKNIEKKQVQRSKKRSKKMTKQRSTKIKKQMRAIAAALVITIGLFGVGVNTSEAFAATVADIPILGSLARVFTIERVQETTDAYVTDLNIPGLEGLQDKKLQKEINQLVHSQVAAATEETKVLIDEYKTAYLETGGTEADYIPREIKVDYAVKCLNDQILSFAVFKTDTLASAYFDMFYYNYDLTTSKPITLQGLLGQDYKKIANQQIAAQIAERAKVDGNTYWGINEPSQDGFSTISDEQQFYVNAAGNPVIIFDKYEIAPGYMGIQEFEITK